MTQILCLLPGLVATDMFPDGDPIAYAPAYRFHLCGNDIRNIFDKRSIIRDP
jgi:hypothetical protein